MEAMWLEGIGGGGGGGDKKHKGTRRLASFIPKRKTEKRTCSSYIK